MAWEPYVETPIDPEALGDMTMAEVFPDPNTWLPAYLNFGKPYVEMPQTGQTVCLVLFGLGTLATIIYAITLLRKTTKRSGGLASAWPIFMMIAGFIAVVYETYDCTTLHCLYPQYGGLHAFTFWGETIPVYLILIYPFYVSALMLFVFDWIERGKATKKVFWIIALFAFSGAFAFEPIALHFGMWYYWGPNQPFKILGFPFYWFFVNPAMIAAVGPCAHFIWNDLMKRKHSWALMIIVPFLLFGIHLALNGPTQIALNTTLNTTYTNIAGFASCLLSVGVILIAANLCERQNNQMIQQMIDAGLDPELEANPKKAKEDSSVPAGAAAAVDAEGEAVSANPAPSATCEPAVVAAASVRVPRAMGASGA